MFYELIEIAILVLLWIFDGAADLCVGEALPDHRSTGGRQSPIRRAWRQMGSSEVVILMTCDALLCRNTVAICASAYIHRVRMTVISLARKVALRVTVHASRMPQH